MYVDDEALFDVPDTESDLEQLLMKRLVDPAVSEKVMKSRRAAFEQYVSTLEGTATKCSIELIQRWGRIGRERRSRLKAVGPRPASATADQKSHSPEVRLNLQHPSASTDAEGSLS
jgi:hypothetical protein